MRNAVCTAVIFVSMANNKENLIITLNARRRENGKNQLRSILLESYCIFGADFVREVTKECESIYNEFISISNE